MAVDAVHLLVGVGLGDDISLFLMAVLAGLLDGRLGVVVLPVVAGDFMRVVAGNATHALFIMLGHHELGAFRTAGRAGGLRLDVEAVFDLALTGFRVHVFRDEVGALVAAFAVRLEAVGLGTNKVAAGAVAFFTSNTFGDGVLLEFLRVAESGEEFLLVLKVELEGVADFAVGGSRLEEEFLFVLGTVGGHAPLVGAGRTEVFHLGREVGDHLGDFSAAFRGEPGSPAAGELIAAGDERTRTVAEETVSDVVGTADEPAVDVAVLRARRTDRGVDDVRRDAVGKDRSVGAVQLLLQVVVDFRMFAGEADRLSMTGTLPLLVLDRVAFAAAFRTHELVRVVENGLGSETVLGSGRLGAGGLRVLLGIAFTEEFGTARGHLVDALDAAFGCVLENGVIFEEEVEEFLFLDDVVLQRLDALRGFVAVRVRVNRLRERVHILVTDTRGVRSNSLSGQSHGDRAKQDGSRCFSGSGLHSFIS